MFTQDTRTLIPVILSVHLLFASEALRLGIVFSRKFDQLLGYGRVCELAREPSAFFSLFA
jgi:hypothetical protein